MKGVDQPTEAQRRKAIRRLQALAAVLMAAAALAFWTASRLTWATVAAEDHLSPQRAFEVKGSDWSPWLTPLAIVMLAAIAAALSLRGWAVRVVAILVAAGGVLAVVPALSMVVGGPDSDYAARVGNIPVRFRILYVDTHGWVAAIVLLGTVCTVVAGVALLRIANGAAMSSKYQTPAARRDELERQVFADYERRKQATAAAASGPAPGATTDEVAAPTGPFDSEVKATDSTAPADDADTADGPAVNERMMWDALDTGIDPTDPTDRGR